MQFRYAIIGPRPDPYPDLILPLPAPQLGAKFIARVILFDQPARPNTEWFIFAYAADGNYAGDSWYTSLENAEQTARQSYGAALGPWLTIEAPAFGDASIAALKLAKDSA